MEYLLLAIAIPGAAGFFALLLPVRFTTLRAALGFLGALAAFVTGLALLEVRGTATFASCRVGPLDLALTLRADGFSSWAVAFTGLMSFLVVTYSAGWFRGRGGAPGRHFGLLLLATAGTVGVLLAGHLMLLVLCWEVVTAALFLLVAGGRPDGARAARKAFVLLGLADVALLLGVVLLNAIGRDAGLDAPLDTAALASHPLRTDTAPHAAVFLLILAAACAKAGAMPLHTWIPTMSTSTNASVMAFLPASLDKVLGIYLLARLSLEWTAPSAGLRMVVMILGAVTILGAVFMAMVQHDLRRLLSFHAISQVGYMLLGIGTGTVIGVMGGIFHMLNHAIYKSCLFLGAGVVEREAGTTDLGRLGGLGRTMPLTFGAMLVAALAISGIPPLNGFASKWLVYQGCVAAGQPVFLVAALFGSVLTLASFVKVLHSVFWGPPQRRLAGVCEHGLALRTPLVVLAALCVLLGVFAALPLDAWIGPAAGFEQGAAVLDGVPAALAGPSGAPVTTVAPAAGVAGPSFRPLLVTGLLLTGVLAALYLAHLGRMGWRRVRTVFIGGEPLDAERNTFPGTEFYRTVGEMPGVGHALQVAERGTFDVYDIGARVGAPAVRLLRRMHTGLLTDYLFWCFLGLALLAAVLVWS